MSELAITALLIASLFLILGSGVWIGLTLTGVAWIAMELFSSRAAGDAMAVTIWGSSSSWTLTALPLFIWMGEILFRTKLSESMFKGLAPWVNWLPGRLLHTNVIGCTIFAAVSGSSAATCATIGKMTLPELTRRGYPQDQIIGSLAGAGTLGLLIPPSIIMIVYGVTAEVSISQLFVAGVLPGLLLASLFSGYIIVWSLLNPGKIPPSTEQFTFVQRLYESRHLIPVMGLIGAVLGSIYAGIATATEAAAVGVIGSFVLSAAAGLTQPQHLQRSAHGRDAAVLHDCADSGGRLLFDPQHGLHRPAAPLGGVRHLAAVEPVFADRRTGRVLCGSGLLSGRYLDGGAHHGRHPSHGAGGTH